MEQRTKENTREPNTGALSRTRIYTFELLMSVIGLLVTAFVVDYGIFSIFRQLTGPEGFEYGNSGFIVFIMAAMIVWLPVAVVFYLRTKGEIQATKTHTETMIHKVLVSLFMFVNIFAVIGALFYAIYMLLQVFVGANDESVNYFLRFILPGVLMALWHSWLFFAYSRVRFAPRKIFSIVLSAITIIVVVTLFLQTAIGMRAQAMDAKMVSDLALISQAITEEYNDDSQLPEELSTLKPMDLNFALSDYSYEKVDGGRYQLCAEFAVAASPGYRDFGLISDPGYVSSPNWSSHKAGEQCYKVKISGNNTYKFNSQQ